MITRLLYIILIIATLSIECSFAQVKDRLQVSPDRHSLQWSNGEPFFYLADTAWELIHRLNREDVDTYLKLRKDQGYNVIQTVVLSEFDGLNTPNAYGHKPFDGKHPSSIAIREGADNDYWDHIEYILSRATDLGLFVGLLPTWGHFWNDDNSFFDKQSAAQYANYMAERYSKYNVIWILGGDRNPKNRAKEDIVRSMATAIKAVDKHNLITFHPGGWQSSATWFHNDDWLDFNSRQSGSQREYNSHIKTYENYLLEPTKPVADIEPQYEVFKDYDPLGKDYSTAADARRSIYWAAFFGACGVTYGHNSVWQMYDPKNGFEPRYDATATWLESIKDGAGANIPLLKDLLYSRPFFSRRPAPELLVKEGDAVPGEDIYHIAALMDRQGSYAMVYNPCGRSFSINGHMLKATNLVAWWFDPQTGKATKIGKIKNLAENLRFTPPTPNEVKDWVLVLDDATKNYPTPAKKSKKLK